VDGFLNPAWNRVTPSYNGGRMPSVYDIKPAFQRLLRPVSDGLARAGLTPNQVTLAALALSAAVGGAIALWPQRRLPLLVLPAALFLRMALNAIDGMMAREHDMQSPAGAVLNEVGDVVSDAALYLPLALVDGVRAPLIVAVVLLAAIAEMAGLAGLQTGAGRRYDGPMGKSDRALVFGALGLALGLGAPAGRWLDAVLAVTALLLVATVANRARRAARGARP